MIPITASTAILFYLGLMIVVLFTLWIVSHMKSRKKTGLPPLYRFIQCEYCHHPFLIKPEKKVHKCPQCQCYLRRPKD